MWLVIPVAEPMLVRSAEVERFHACPMISCTMVCPRLYLKHPSQLVMCLCPKNAPYNFLLVVSTPLKNISQNGNLPQIGVNIKNIWNHRLDLHVNVPKCQSADWRLCKQRMTLSENRQTLRRKLVLQPSIFRCYCWWKKSCTTWDV